MGVNCSIRERRQPNSLINDFQGSLQPNATAEGSRFSALPGLPIRPSNERQPEMGLVAPLSLYGKAR